MRKELVFVFLVFLTLNPVLAGVANANATALIGEQINLELPPRSFSIQAATRHPDVHLDRNPKPVQTIAIQQQQPEQQQQQQQQPAAETQPEQQQPQQQQQPIKSESLTLAGSRALARTFQKHLTTPITALLNTYATQDDNDNNNNNNNNNQPKIVKLLRHILATTTTTTTTQEEEGEMLLFGSTMLALVIAIAGAVMSKKATEAFEKGEHNHVSILKLAHGCAGVAAIAALSALYDVGQDEPSDIFATNFVSPFLIVGFLAIHLISKLRTPALAEKAPEGHWVTAENILTQVIFVVAIFAILYPATAGDETQKFFSTFLQILLVGHTMFVFVRLVAGVAKPEDTFTTTRDPKAQPPFHFSEPRIVVAGVVCVITSLLLIVGIPYIPLGATTKIIQSISLVFVFGLQFYWFYMTEWRADQLMGDVAGQFGEQITKEEIKPILTNQELCQCGTLTFQIGDGTLHIIRNFEHSGSNFWKYLQHRKTSAVVSTSEEAIKKFVTLLNKLLTHENKSVNIKSKVLIPIPMIINPTPGEDEDALRYYRKATTGEFVVLLEKHLGFEKVGQLEDGGMAEECESANQFADIRVKCWYSASTTSLVVLPYLS